MSISREKHSVSAGSQMEKLKMGHGKGMIPWEIAQCPEGHNIP